MKRLLLASLIETTKVEGLIVRQCILCPIALTPMLIGCNQETIIQEEGEASSIASTCQANVTFYRVDPKSRWVRH